MKNEKLHVTFDNQTTIQFFKLHIALLAMDVTTKVKVGENAGKNLSHDFVVIKQKQIHSNKAYWGIQLSEEFFQSHYPKTAIVIWVEDLNNPTPIQAVGSIIN